MLLTRYYLVCVKCREHIQSGENIYKIKNMMNGLSKGEDTAHTLHHMHIIDDQGNKVAEINGSVLPV